MGFQPLVIATVVAVSGASSKRSVSSGPWLLFLSLPADHLWADHLAPHTIAV